MYKTIVALLGVALCAGTGAAGILDVDFDSLATGVIDGGGATTAQLNAATTGGTWDLNSAATHQVQADDDGSALVGVTVAEILGIPHAALVVSTEADDDEESMTVHRELEGGLHEVLEIELPALLTIQTGINEPRYASIFGIRKAMKKQIEVLDLDDLDLAEEAVGEAGSKTSLVKLFIPVVTAQATILEGAPEQVSSELVTILKNEGVA